MHPTRIDVVGQLAGLVVVISHPGNLLGCVQVGPGHGAGTAPVDHERLAEEVLADALFGDP